ncbi:hypothetical protein ACIA5C_20000 [Actinoplanes sp. NPDC051343]|jgi:hypothetical protein|uniref:hypothetical protein n=1 Tax=Actinoplanes sp. NPDC051343 TaxID=3363906 RepID=UPI0037AEEE3E
MTAPGNDPLFLALTLGLLMSTAYALGRIHQWHRHGLQRDEAYRRGYDRASVSILSIMTRRSPVRVGRLAADRPQLYRTRHEECDRTGI